MKIKYSKQDEVEMIRFLRYRKNDPTTSKLTYMPIQSIAKFLAKSPFYVYSICQKLQEG